MDEEKGFKIDDIIEGDTVADVLGYVQYEKPEVMQKIEGACEEAVKKGDMSPEESVLLQRRFEDTLAGSTYLTPCDR
ncbi:hypothetical protein KAI87_15785, partial [Myxococcota bacterium]|nr:hypothetical protein [Myxococcota bacterium]